MTPTLVTSCTALPPEGAEARGSKPACAGLDGPKRGLLLAAPRVVALGWPRGD